MRTRTRPADFQGLVRPLGKGSMLRVFFLRALPQEFARGNAILLRGQEQPSFRKRIRRHLLRRNDSLTVLLISTMCMGRTDRISLWSYASVRQRAHYRVRTQRSATPVARKLSIERPLTALSLPLPVPSRKYPYNPGK